MASSVTSPCDTVTANCNFNKPAKKTSPGIQKASLCPERKAERARKRNSERERERVLFRNWDVEFHGYSFPINPLALCFSMVPFSRPGIQQIFETTEWKTHPFSVSPEERAC